MQKHILIISGIVVAVLLAVFFITQVLYDTSPRILPEPEPLIKKQQPINNQYKRTDIDPTKLPERFASTIPLETDAKVTENFNAQYANGSFESTRGFISQKNIQENFEIYQAYFSKNGWSIVTTSQLDGLSSIGATKGLANAVVSISENSVSGDIKVTITIVESAK